MSDRPRRKVSVSWLFGFALLWWMLSGPDPGPGVWGAGLVAVALAVVLHTGLGGRRGRAVTFRGVVRFIPYFLAQSFLGGLDVARRAFSPGPPLSPGFVDYRLSLPTGPPRVFFVGCLSLLPGTFSARFDGDVVRVHFLSDDSSGRDRLARLEGRVAHLFGAGEDV